MWVGVELIKEVHDGVSLKVSGTNHHMLLTLRSMGRIRPPELLSLHPRKCQLFELWEAGKQRHSQSLWEEE